MIISLIEDTIESIEPIAVFPADNNNLIISRTMLNYLWNSHQVVFSTDISFDKRFQKTGIVPESIERLVSRAAAIYPLICDDKIKGIIYLEKEKDKRELVIKNLKLLQQLAEDISLYLKRNIQVSTIECEINSLKSKYGDKNIYVGISSKIKKMLKVVEKVTNLDTTLLISGETGTGKDLLAEIIHNKSTRKDSRFISLNCATFQETTLESELFGVVAGLSRIS